MQTSRYTPAEAAEVKRSSLTVLLLEHTGPSYWTTLIRMSRSVEWYQLSSRMFGQRHRFKLEPKAEDKRSVP